MNNLDQNGGRNGGRDDRRSGAGDVFFNAEPEEWSRRRSKKRKTRTSNTESQSKIDIEQFKTLNTDDKLSALFTKFNSNTEFLSSIEDKVNQCLQISSITDYNKSSIDDHESRLLLLEYKSIDIEARSRRKNLLFNGFAEERDESCATKICAFLRESLDINDAISVDRAHRLGRFRRGTDRPIIVAFRDYQDTQLILSSANKLKGTHYSVNRDYPQEIVDARKSLWSEYKRIRQDHPNDKVTLAYPAKIVMNGSIMKDAFPHWGKIMKGRRIQHIDKPSLHREHREHEKQDSRARPNTNTNTRLSPTRSMSRSSGTSVEQQSNQDVHSPASRRESRSRSRSHTRRGRPHTPRRRGTKQGSATVREPNIRRPWDSGGDSHQSQKNPHSSSR